MRQLPKPRRRSGDIPRRRIASRDDVRDFVPDIPDDAVLKEYAPQREE